MKISLFWILIIFGIWGMKHPNIEFWGKPWYCDSGKTWILGFKINLIIGYDFLGNGYLDGALFGQGTWYAWIQIQVSLFWTKYIPSLEPNN